MASPLKLCSAEPHVHKAHLQGMAVPCPAPSEAALCLRQVCGAFPGCEWCGSSDLRPGARQAALPGRALHAGSPGGCHPRMRPCRLRCTLLPCSRLRSKSSVCSHAEGSTPKVSQNRREWRGMVWLVVLDCAHVQVAMGWWCPPLPPSWSPPPKDAKANGVMPKRSSKEQVLQCRRMSLVVWP